MSIAKNYYKKAAGVLLVFDLNKKSSFVNLTNWIREIREEIAPSVPIVLLGNKCDLKEDKREVGNEVEDFTYKHELQYFETSAKTGYNVEKAFEHITNAICKNMECKIASAIADLPGIRFMGRKNTENEFNSRTVCLKERDINKTNKCSC